MSHAFTAFRRFRASLLAKESSERCEHRAKARHEKIAVGNKKKKKQKAAIFEWSMKDKRETKRCKQASKGNV